MMEQIFSGKTVEEAIEVGLTELGLTQEQVNVEVLDEGKKKLFGSVPAQVKITPKRTDGERAVAFLEGLLPLLKTEATPVLRREDEKIEIELQADSTHGIIGRRGEIIDAIQILAGAVANIGRDEYKRVVVDCENYRENREDTLRHVAEKLAAKAVRLGKRVRLEPMNPYERRIIHAALVDNDQVTTKSEGKEPTRFVVITPNNLKPYEKRNDRYSRGDRNDRNNRQNGSRTYRNDRGNDRRYGDRKTGDRPYGDKKYGEKKYGDRQYGERKPYPKRELPAEDTPQTSGTSFRREGSSSGYKKGSFNGFFGTYLGNSREDPTPTTPETPTKPEE